MRKPFAPSSTRNTDDVHPDDSLRWVALQLNICGDTGQRVYSDVQQKLAGWAACVESTVRQSLAEPRPNPDLLGHGRSSGIACSTNGRSAGAFGASAQGCCLSSGEGLDPAGSRSLTPSGSCSPISRELGVSRYSVARIWREYGVRPLAG